MGVNIWEGTKAERVAMALEGMAESRVQNRVFSLDNTVFAGGTIVEAIGIPVYVDNVAAYTAFGITQTGWYVFGRIAARCGVRVTGETSITGAAGYIKTIGNDYVDVAVRFGVAAESQTVTVNWGPYTDKVVFKATDLAVRNLDYRTTFYVYDAAPFAEWSYTPATDAAFAGTTYYILQNGVYVKAPVIAYQPVTADTYYTHSYALTADETFTEGKTYYTKNGETYTPAEVTAGEAVTANTYYEDVYTLTTDKEFVGTAYFTKDGEVFKPAAIIGGDPHYAYYEDHYELTEDETFADGKTYYTESGGVYSAATVTPGDPVTEDTYYEHSYVLTEDTAFVEGKTYYTLSGTTYSEAVVTAGTDVPTLYYVHSKVRFDGMTRNVTYRLDTPVDCPSEFVLPEVSDDDHGCWYEIRLRHTGSFSSTLIPADPAAKVATEHTQAETAGINMIDLHYTNAGGVKIWRFMNTHSSIPA